MVIETIERDFINSVSAEIELVPDGKDRFYVYTPFRFNDGDHLSIVLKKEGKQWVLSDEGHTYMHLTYRIDEKQLFKGIRQNIISRARTSFGVEDRNGELILRVQEANYGSALYAFAQSLLKITSVSSVSWRRRSGKKLLNDFQTSLSSVVSEDCIKFDWTDDVHDPDGKYKVDCRINGMKESLFVYALFTTDKIHRATISLYAFKEWKTHDFRSVGIIENQTKVSQKRLDCFRSVADDCYSLEESRSKIREIIALTS